MAQVVRVAPGVHWHALEDDVVVGRGHALHRPDARVLVSADAWRDDIFRLLIGAMATDLPGPLFTVVDHDDREMLGRFADLGFSDHRREDDYVMPASDVSGSATLPSGFAVQTADRVDEDRLRELDQALRRELPGSAGWISSPDGFRRAVFDERSFDPATFLVATHGEHYAGMVRITKGRRPRLALAGVLPPYRRRGLGRALMVLAFKAAAERGSREVFTDVDQTNVAGQALVASMHARRIGGSVELRRNPASRA